MKAQLAKPRLRFVALCLGALLQALATTVPAQSLPPEVVPATKWHHENTATHGSAILKVHLRTLHERRIRFPEAIELTENSTVPDKLFMRKRDDELSLSALASFERVFLEFKGLDTGNIYRLSVRASDLGKRIPLKIVLP
ncbi:MAG: hypothetical protein CSA54_01000 [Gammaproteobacteria bacterium]|nr:MAG: hypothetical protein CSA54_01000 [Gammaproteobacteria bacterium]